MKSKYHQDKNIASLILLGLSHKTAPVETRELLTLPQSQLSDFYKSLKEAGVEEAVYVSTCNRVEIYMTAEDKETAVEIIKRMMGFYTKLPHEQFVNSVYAKYGMDAVRHLFSVASSLDSMVLGENEITGQIKESYRKAVEFGTTGNIMNRLFHKAFNTSKRVRSETGISKNPLSMASIAVDQARAILPDLSRRSALLIGAGEMGELILKYLVKEDMERIILANRTRENAERICVDIDYEAEIIPLARVDKALVEVDIVISSVTAPHHVITAYDMTEIMAERTEKPIVLIDIAVPRNIDPDVAGIKGVHLYNVDSLKSIADSNKNGRLNEIIRAEKMIDEEVDDFAGLIDELSLAPTITVIKNKFNEIREKELKKYRGKKMKHLSDEDFRLVEEVTNQIMNKTLHNPIINMKNLINCCDESESDESIKKNAKFLEDIFTKC